MTSLASLSSFIRRNRAFDCRDVKRKLVIANKVNLLCCCDSQLVGDAWDNIWYAVGSTFDNFINSAAQLVLQQVRILRSEDNGKPQSRTSGETGQGGKR